MLEGGITLESLFEPLPMVRVKGIEDVDLDSCPPEHPGERSDLKCGECQAPMVLLKGAKFKNMFYGCSRYPDCKSSHGAHADGTPKGIPGNKATRLARIFAHTVFDQIWKQRLVKHRGAAYAWMRQVMGLSKSQAHIAALTKEQCEQLIALVYRDYPILKNKYARLLYDEDPFNEI